MEMNFWRNKRVFVTGATGLLGTWLIRHLLDSGAYVAALVRDRDCESDFFRSGLDRRIDTIQGEIENYRTIERGVIHHGIDTVFHLAAQTIVGTARRHPFETFEANIRGTYNLLEVCRVQLEMVKRVVIASSDKAYGPSENLPYRENMPVAGRFPYDVSKSCSDLIAQSYFHTYGLPVAVARCGNLYGGGDLHWSRIIPGTIRSLWNGEAPVIRSDGAYLRDYLYVGDAADGYMRMAEALEFPDVWGEAFNLGPGHPYRVREVVDLICRLMHREDLEPVLMDHASAEIRDQYLNSGKAARLLNWKPCLTLEQGLARTIEWYCNYFGPRECAISTIEEVTAA